MKPAAGRGAVVFRNLTHLWDPTPNIPELHCFQMPFRVPRLRRWFAGGAILVLAVVTGTYFYASWRVRNALKEVPGKIGLNVQQSAQGFTVSRSEAGRTLFKVQASKA